MAGVKIVQFMLIHNCLHQVWAEVNLFDIDTSTDSYIPCERSLISSFHTRDVTGTRVYETEEEHLKYCYTQCQDKSLGDDFCKTHEPEYKEELGFVTNQEKCCDEKKCKCICHYSCKTFESQMKELKAVGFIQCTKGSTKEDALTKARESCDKEKGDLMCEKEKMNFMCPKQFVCVQNECIFCIKPSCATDKDLQFTEVVVNAVNQSSTRESLRPNEKLLKMRGGRNFQLPNVEPTPSSVNTGIML